ncbi:fimbrial protein [Actinomycetales bacterium SN12]|nr:fimbrial protein [Actinomycetales bacterium SN12]
MMRSTSRASRYAAGAGLLALGAIALGSPAFAATAPEYGNINTAANGKITVHLHEHQSGTGDPAGSTLPNAIKGVVFTAYQLTNFDVSKATDWDALSAARTVPADACDATPKLGSWTLDAGSKITTDASGIATLDLTKTAGAAVNTRLGAYLVCQTSDATKLTDKAAPFVVTVPFPDNQATAPSNSNGWLYDVHAYPKNSLVPTITKTPLKQSELGLGSTASYEVVTDVPRIAEGNQFTSYTITDPMDTRLAQPSVSSVTVDGAALTAGEDYIAETTETATGNVAMVHFTKKGLQRLKTSGGKKVTTVFAAKVSSLGTGETAGKIDNFAYLTTGNAALTSPPEQPAKPTLATAPTPQKPFADGVVPTATSAAATQFWGDVQAVKIDAGDQKTPLAGAEFAVYEAADPYPSGECATEVRQGSTPIKTGSTVTSNASGVIAVPGLFVTDSSNTSVTSRCYVLVETKAPAGFVLPNGGKERTAVKVTAGLTDTATAYDATITNTKNTMPALPLTGASGQIVLITLGAGLVLVAIGAALVARRRRAEPAAQSID